MVRHVLKQEQTLDEELIMFRTAGTALVLALSLSIGAGCAADVDEDVGTDEGAQSANALARSYEGTIGDLKVVMRVETHGANVTGSYLYADKVGNGDRLLLKGTAAGGKLTLTESVNGAGPTTGTFAATISARGITGTWKSGTRSLALALTPITSPKTFKQKIKETATSSSRDRDCLLEAELVGVYGLADARAESAINEALGVEGIERDANGKCDGGDIRYVTQSVKLSTTGFLTIQAATEYGGGAHPENASELFNFAVDTGARLTANDFFLPGSSQKVKDLVVRAINADAELDADEKRDSIETLDPYFPLDTDLDALQFGVTAKGLVLDMTSIYPHVIVALAPVVDLAWADLRPLLKPDAPILPLTR